MSDVCKSIFPHEDPEHLNAFFGDPRGANGQVSKKWYAENMVKWVPPYPMFYSDGAHTPFKSFMIHKKTYNAFDSGFKEVLDVMGLDKIKALHLNISGGIFCYRLQRGGTRLSVHSWGVAIDMDPANNPFPKKWKKGMIDPQFCEILEKHGFWWRGENGDTDPMHFQCCWRGS